MMSNPQQTNSSIVIRFNTMRLEVASSCLFDFLEVREGRCKIGFGCGGGGHMFIHLFIYFSSPEPKANGELIVYQSSRRLSGCVCVCVSVCKQLQTCISPQPVGQL